MNSTTFVLFGKYCLIMDQLGSKDSSRDFQLNCVISYFFTYIYYFMHGSKDWCDEESKKNSNFWGASKQNPVDHPSRPTVCSCSYTDTRKIRWSYVHARNLYICIDVYTSSPGSYPSVSSTGKAGYLPTCHAYSYAS
jgi:hypothetical protein